MTFLTERRAVVLLLALLSFTPLGCDLVGSSSDTSVQGPAVYVANAGGFGNDNSSVTIYDASTQQSQELPPSGPGFTSYIQSLQMASSRFYLLFGETNRVGVYSTESTEQVDEISGIRNPRYMAVSGDNAFVTSQDFRPGSKAKLYKVNLSNNAVVDSLKVGGTPEDVIIDRTGVYVALGGRNGSIALVGEGSMTLGREIPVDCDAPRSLAIDQQDELLVFCAGSTIYNDDFEVVDRTDGAIRVVDTNTKEVTTEIPLDTMLTSASQGQRVFYSAEADEAFAVLADQQIIRFDASTNEIVDTFSALGAPIGAVAFDAATERLYVGRTAPSDRFSAAGSVTVHRRDGMQVNSFEAGIAPTYIDFYRNRD